MVIREAIINGVLAPASKIPSSRSLASSLKLSRTTISTALDQLFSEGFLITRQGDGTYIADLKFTSQSSKNLDGHVFPASQAKNPPSRRLEGTPLKSSNIVFSGNQLLPGFVDHSLFPYGVWNKLYKKHSLQIGDALKQFTSGNGFFPLCQSIARHLAISRGINVRPEQVFITHGASQSVSLIAKTVSQPGDSAWIENPGYPMIAETLEMEGLKPINTEIDHHGLNPSTEQIRDSSPRLICTSTSYQFPLGYTMPISRRLKLIDIAKAKDSWLLEDDYDGEFRYKGNPIPAMFGLENNERTLYMGTFSKTLSLSLRMSFVVVPLALVESFQAIYPMLGNFSSVVSQAALAELISSGRFAKHVSNMRKIYGRRRRALEQALVGNHINHQEAFNPGGLHIVAELQGKDVTDSEIMEAISDTDISCIPLSFLYREPVRAKQGFLLGFTSCDEDKILNAVSILQSAVQQRGATLSPL
ncbi:PLP-dependent aminotransferase family protein [Pseudoteredinibacter isoporae]|uniref:GntR family transcriptional regulator/MocR family aminotransferase n=1 Tax=Pseudoteredinibacter isoporae TaxID=570281 RepID=A0A7X0JQ15_9GAMM|nr:GntR family transcriptional regulator/MocR family aminotransferase [Pseudoteredinibacter isoporae]NHO85751.1 PLP-dependent aminotransferase family protein [Pseudoteredinibacter isoporae]